jgi:BirA family biotin operon repressor/biotin-[acetyl-CoA-carboxylase] ligase
MFLSPDLDELRRSWGTKVCCFAKMPAGPPGMHMESLPILKLLADGELHSGEELGGALGVSRAAVWKQVQRLEQETALEVGSIRGRGYQLVQPLELLDADTIQAQLAPGALNLLAQLECHPCLDSTNEWALRLAQQNEALSGLVVTAECQRAGRGRRGRSWVSPFGRNLYCSVLWRFEEGAAALEGLSLAVGLALANALDTVGVAGVQLKWPNDLVWQGRKLAGILVEMTGDPSGQVQAVVGFGINIGMRSTAAAAAIDQPWVDVEEIAGATISRNRLLGAALDELLPLLADYHTQRFTPWHGQWSARDALRDQRVRVMMGNTELCGTARGVSAQGALLVDAAGERHTIYGGEISLRPE